MTLRLEGPRHISDPCHGSRIELVALIARGDEVTMAFVAVGFVATALIARASPVAFVAMGKASDVTIYSEAWRLSLGLALRGERRKRWPNR